jgi:anion-transporting  ArsA/GET3 family ATPase
VVAVAMPEEMAINETLALSDAMAEDGLALELVILNALYPTRFDDDEADALAAAVPQTRSPLARSALRAAVSEHARAGRQRDQQERLRDALDCAVVELPYLFAEQIARPELDTLTDLLETAIADQQLTR